MLILSRKLNESIVIDGKIIIKIIRVEGDTVKLGIEAPIEIPVHRQEVYAEIQQTNAEAISEQKPVPPRNFKPLRPVSDQHSNRGKV